MLNSDSILSKSNTDWLHETNRIHNKRLPYKFSLSDDSLLLILAQLLREFSHCVSFYGFIDLRYMKDVDSDADEDDEEKRFLLIFCICMFGWVISVVIKRQHCINNSVLGTSKQNKM
uniref:Uncharacterized protein n=1 Tax=Glossina austeni TaxID=7395 RepID=A0A1A9VTI2_GLOAU